MGTKDPAPLPETISAQERFISTYRMSPVGAGKRGRQHRSHRHHQHRKLGQFGLIMTIGLTLDAMNREFTAPERTGSWFHGVQMVRRMRTVMLMVPVCREFSFLGRAFRLRPASRVGGAGGGGLLDWESEQKVEMTFGDFGASVSAGALPAGELYAAGR